MKTIKPRDTRQTLYDDLLIGDVVVEGIIVHFHREDALYCTPGGTFQMEPTEEVPVLCRVTEDMVVTTCAAMLEQQMGVAVDDLPTM